MKKSSPEKAGMSRAERWKQRATELAAAVAAAPSVESLHALGDHIATESGGQAHARAAYSRAISLAHDSSGWRTTHGHSEEPVVPDGMRRERRRALRLPKGREREAAVSVYQRLEALQHPADCSRAPVLLVPLWACCEGLASRVHTVAAALAQGIWSNTTTIVVSAAAILNGEQPETMPGVEQLGLLQPIGGCTIEAALDASELQAVRAGIGACSHPPPRPGEKRALQRKRVRTNAASRERRNTPFSYSRLSRTPVPTRAQARGAPPFCFHQGF